MDPLDFSGDSTSNVAVLVQIISETTGRSVEDVRAAAIRAKRKSLRRDIHQRYMSSRDLKNVPKHLLDTLIKISKIDKDFEVSYELIMDLVSHLPNNDLISSEQSLHLDALLDTVPKDVGYDKKAESLASLSHEFRQRIAVELSPALNAHIQGMPHDTYEEKKTLAKWVNAEVERFGLAVKCAKTGLPAKLRGQPGNWPEIGRFAFEVYIDGKRTTPSTSDKLPELQLMDATSSQEPSPPELESETAWQNEVGPKSTRRGRKLT